MKAGEKRSSQNDMPASVRPFTVGRRVILTDDAGNEVRTKIRTKPQRFPGGSWRAQVDGRIAWYAVTKLRVDASNQLEMFNVNREGAR